MNIKEILKAKFSSKENMSDWYYERLDKCYSCKHNSGNNDKISLVNKFRISHNFGKDSCLICSCGVTDKASSEISQCPLPNPKWLARKVETSVKHRLENKNPEVADLLFNKKLGVYYLDYGLIDKGTETTVNLIIISKNKISNLATKSSCGCTAADHKKVNGDYYVEVGYGKHKVGQIAQGVTISFKDELNQDRKLIIKLRGEIK